MITAERKKSRQLKRMAWMRKAHIRNYENPTDLLCNRPYCEGRVQKTKYNKYGLCPECLTSFEEMRLKFWRFNGKGEAYNAVVTRREIMDTFNIDPMKHKEL